MIGHDKQVNTEYVTVFIVILNKMENKYKP